VPFSSLFPLATRDVRLDTSVVLKINGRGYCNTVRSMVRFLERRMAQVQVCALLVFWRDGMVFPSLETSRQVRDVKRVMSK
jgi:hypothetical protein